MRASERRALRAITADALRGVVAIPADSPHYWQALDTLHTARAHRRALLTLTDWPEK
ncbi:hypothetical protein SEA_EMIANNA_87 [Gordonia phage Emianna]|uniref:Uncharacterized protein n=1 Tax=Gordonia phage Emianna TaxID=2315530 RepID=A0A386KDM4_9CAUD|nr:hypothetical protein KNU15_gp87 [Gordonia phage Emianna]AYD84199.1 hypothetical protein SEA_JIFALL16_85 [Gordonia phage Jifall16]AYD84358.1 hypothetical protein SEA_KURT_87 [Gordonia phage Kurt]QOP66746.1 hypothetical protein SEA_NOVUMREGINA_85 [Gordonia phage NovumRegina]QOR55927.1 hypothetical protein SEA_GROOTJR_87 [Gordonia phage GrootJr]QZD98928.1 hypothetical protein SEA_TRACKER_85 [Gordonia phage Tracker]WNM66124.1 hypothetical protein SEA_WHEEZY_84 [Gordonia phage Wheezy]